MLGCSLMELSPLKEYPLGCIVHLRSLVFFINTISFVLEIKPQYLPFSPCRQVLLQFLQTGTFKCQKFSPGGSGRAGDNLSLYCLLKLPAAFSIQH